MSFCVSCGKDMTSITGGGIHCQACVDQHGREALDRARVTDLMTAIEKAGSRSLMFFTIPLGKWDEIKKRFGLP